MKNRSNQSVADQLFQEALDKYPALPTRDHITVKQACLMVVEANPDMGFHSLRIALVRTLRMVIPGFPY